MGTINTENIPISAELHHSYFSANAASLLCAFDREKFEMGDTHGGVNNGGRFSHTGTSEKEALYARTA